MLRSDLAAIMADLPVTCSYKGTSFTATASELGTEREIEVAGEIMEVDRTIVFDASALTTLPSADEVVIVGVSRYRVQRRVDHQDGVGCELLLRAEVR
jgi:hypothetical protein